MDSTQPFCHIRDKTSTTVFKIGEIFAMNPMTAIGSLLAVPFFTALVLVFWPILAAIAASV